MDPVSITVLVVVALFAGVGAGAAVAVNWDHIIIWWSGKRLAILGSEMSGKTTLHSFLKHRSIPRNYDPTLGVVPSDAKRLFLKDLDLKIKEGSDVGGRTGARDRNWKPIIDESDIILYLVRAHELLSNDQALIERIREDSEIIKEWIKGRKIAPKIAIVGTHADLDARFSEHNHTTLENTFIQNDLIREISVRLGGTGQILVVLGSLKTLDDSERLVYVLFKELGH